MTKKEQKESLKKFKSHKPVLKKLPELKLKFTCLTPALTPRESILELVRKALVIVDSAPNLNLERHVVSGILHEVMFRENLPPVIVAPLAPRIETNYLHLKGVLEKLLAPSGPKYAYEPQFEMASLHAIIRDALGYVKDHEG